MRISDWSSDVCSSDLRYEQLWRFLVMCIFVILFTLHIFLCCDLADYRDMAAGFRCLVCHAGGVSCWLQHIGHECTRSSRIPWPLYGGVVHCRERVCDWGAVWRNFGWQERQHIRSQGRDADQCVDLLVRRAIDDLCSKRVLAYSSEVYHWLCEWLQIGRASCRERVCQSV